MKILHTSDWHLGHVLYGHDRTDEQQDMLDQMVEIAEETKPDLFLVSGDVYHTVDPKPAVQKMFNKACSAENVQQSHCSLMQDLPRNDYRRHGRQS